MISQHDIDLAAHTDLISFCAFRGLEVVKEGREYFLKDYDSLYISAVQPWKWYRHSIGEGGKAIDFCVKFLGMSFQQAVSELLSFAGRSPELPEREPERVAFSSAAPDARRVIAYLCKKRGVDYNIVKDLLQSGKLYQDERGNCVFSVYDFDGNQIDGEIHGTGDIRFKSRISCSQQFGFTLRSFDGCVRTLCFFESAIDLISFYQIYQGRIKNFLLVSMGGLKPAILYQYSDYYRMADVFLFVDNCKSGEDFAQRMHFSLKVPPVGKDWNEYLLYLRENN